MSRTQEQVAGTVRAQLRRLADEHGDRRAVVFAGRSVTYTELERRSLAFAAALDASGIGEGERVAALLPNSVEWLVAYLGTAASGRVFVGLNTWFTGEDLAYVLRKCGARMLLMTDRFRSHDYLAVVRTALGDGATVAPTVTSAALPDLRWVVSVGDGVDERSLTWDELLATAAPDAEPRFDPRPDDPALIVYTSGSTGLPKGVVLTHGALLENGLHIGDRQHVSAEDRLWIASPLFFSYGCANAVMVVLSHGCTLLLQDVFEATSSLEMIDTEQATVYYATTNMTYALRDELARGPRPLALRTGTAIGTPSQLRAAAELVPGICNIYGMTETYGNCALTDADDPLEVRLTTQGTALPGHVIAIVDPDTEQEVAQGELGEIRVGGLVSPGYFNDPERTAAAFDAEGRLRTGDLGRLDEAGRLCWESRIGDMIKTAGVNVSAAEVERVLETDPRIRQVYVVGVPDEVRGEVIAAVVQPSADDLTEEDVVAFARGVLASYKVPRIVEFRRDGTFPVTATGKVSRRDLTSEVSAMYSSTKAG
jgi:fatty-acyl-CoA synthase